VVDGRLFYFILYVSKRNVQTKVYLMPWLVCKNEIHFVFSELEAVAEETGFVTEADCVLCETQPEYEETAWSIVNSE
jgi:hypothetical protein